MIFTYHHPQHLTIARWTQSPTVPRPTPAGWNRTTREAPAGSRGSRSPRGACQGSPRCRRRAGRTPKPRRIRGPARAASPSVRLSLGAQVHPPRAIRSSAHLAVSSELSSWSPSVSPWALTLRQWRHASARLSTFWVTVRGDRWPGRESTTTESRTFRSAPDRTGGPGNRPQDAAGLFQSAHWQTPRRPSRSRSAPTRDRRGDVAHARRS